MDDVCQTALIAQKSVLVVEDEQLVALDVEQIVHDLGIQHVVCVTSLAGARAALQDENHAFALVILDIKLKDGSGLDLLKECEQLYIPVLIVTGYTDFEYGSLKVMYKPFSSQVLANSIRDLLGIKANA
jgi:DNA-binding NtrC family response regulator